MGNLLIGKGNDVAFQQLIIYQMFLIIQKTAHMLDKNLVFLMTLFFFSLHIPLFYLPKIKKLAKQILFVGIIVGGFIFSYVFVNHTNDALPINYLIHILFYVLYWKLFNKKDMGIITFDQLETEKDKKYKTTD